MQVQKTATDLVQAVCKHIEGDPACDTRLNTLAAKFDCAPATLRRAFNASLGMTPRQYAEGLRANRVRTALAQAGRPAYRAGDAAGHKSTSRLYANAKAEFGMTPGRFKRGGQGETILWATRDTPLGVLLVAATEGGICAVRLGDGADHLLRELRGELPKANFEQDIAALGGWIDEVLNVVTRKGASTELPMDLQASAFQRKVWLSLQQIPYGETRTYKQLAQMVGQPTAVRAVARACATNPAALLIPCHRIVRADGNLAGYRWGIERKRQLLAQEQG